MKRFLATAWLLVGAGLQACGAGNENEVAVPPAILALDPSARDVWDTLPQGQRSLLEDGELTFDEYESATLATVACLTELGYTVDPPPQLDLTGKRLTWQTAGKPGSSAEQLAADADRCEREHGFYVRLLWHQMHEPSAEERRAAEETVEACVADAGVAMPQLGTPAWAQWMSAGGATEGDGALFRCADEVARKTGIQVGGG